MIKASMTARAKQKEDCDRQGNAFDSNATVLPGLRMGLPIEDAGRLDIHRTGSVRSGAALPLHHTETARRLIGGSYLQVPAISGGRAPEHHRLQSGSGSDPADKSMAARCVPPSISNATIVAGGVIQRPRRGGSGNDDDDPDVPGSPGGPGVLVHRHNHIILLRLLGLHIVEHTISMADQHIFPHRMGRKAMDLLMGLSDVLWHLGFVR